MKIALCAIKGNFPDFEKHFMPDWENWEYKVEVNLSLKTIHTQNTQTDEHDDQILKKVTKKGNDYLLEDILNVRFVPMLEGKVK